MIRFFFSLIAVATRRGMVCQEPAPDPGYIPAAAADRCLRAFQNGGRHSIGSCILPDSSFLSRFSFAVVRPVRAEGYGREIMDRVGASCISYKDLRYRPGKALVGRVGSNEAGSATRRQD
jgi:hypothetical protein